MKGLQKESSSLPEAFSDSEARCYVFYTELAARGFIKAITPNLIRINAKKHPFVVTLDFKFIDIT
jgi:hypothetical protein